MKIFNIIFTIVIMTLTTSGCLFAQVSKVPIKLWGLQSIDGIVGIEGEYKIQDQVLRSSLSNTLNSSLFTGQIGLNTESYFYHPNLVSMKAQFEYNPGVRKDVNLILPNRSDVSTGERAGAFISILKTQPISLTCNANFLHQFTNRENTTNVETFNSTFGIGLNYRNSLAPINLSFQKQNIDQNEFQTGRDYNSKRQNIRAATNFAFSEKDENRFTYNYDEYKRKYFLQSMPVSYISSLQFDSRIAFDSSKYDILNTNFYYSKNTGGINFSRIQLNELLKIQLLDDYSYSGNYIYFNYDQKIIETNQHSIKNSLQHKLYKSLTSTFFYNYTNSRRTYSIENITDYGIQLNYVKKIPTGRLSINYSFTGRNFDSENTSPSITIIDEEQQLSVDEITLLNNPYVELNSIRITDVTGTLIYQENFDYIVISRNDFIEIQRLPGGLIPEGKSIYVSYTAIGQPSYNYVVNTNNFSTNLLLFDGFWELYFRINENSFSNVNISKSNILKTLSQRLYGSVINITPISIGVEFDDYNSNIIPYESVRYYAIINANVSNSLSTSISGNLKYINLIKENEKQEFSDIAAKIIYNINRNFSVNIDASYRFQEGKGLDLSLTNARGELKTKFRELIFTIGIEAYKRTYIYDKLNYLGSYFRVERKF